MKAFKNRDDWGDMANQVYMKGGKMVYFDSWFYGQDKAMKQLEDSWKPGGSNYDYWNKEHGVTFKIVDTFSEIKASGRHKKLTSDGIVGVVLDVIPGNVNESLDESVDVENQKSLIKLFGGYPVKIVTGDADGPDYNQYMKLSTSNMTSGYKENIKDKIIKKVNNTKIKNASKKHIAPNNGGGLTLTIHYFDDTIQESLDEALSVDTTEHGKKKS